MIVDWKKIKKGAKYFEVFQSDNDPVKIPISEGKIIAKNLDAKFNLVKNAGHFSAYYDKKFVEFPLLLKTVSNHIRK